MKINTDFLDFSVYMKDLKEYNFSKKTLVNTINQYSFCIAQKDIAFKKALQNSDLLLPDGIGVVVAVKLLNGENIKKIAGADLHRFLLEELNKKGGRCFYLGSSQETLDKIVKNISKEFSNVKVRAFSPPYKNEFSDTDNQQMLHEVNIFKPDVLFVGMTAPKQEKWSYKHRDVLDANIICSIGAVFDFYAGTIVRPNKVWINLGLEWFIRLIKEPKRMWKRYLYYGPIFIKLVLEKKVKSIFN